MGRHRGSDSVNPVFRFGMKTFSLVIEKSKTVSLGLEALLLLRYGIVQKHDVGFDVTPVKEKALTVAREFVIPE
jgi:hypothetical protein